MNKPLILVVEDDTPVRNLITTTLKTHEYRYLSAQNGASAVMEALSHNPDIVLLDLGLPDMDGVEIIQKIRSWSNMPIIVISARTEDSDKIGALDAGADDYLTKPFSVDELLARLRVTQRRLALIKADTAKETPIFTNGALKIDYAAGCAYDEEAVKEAQKKQFAKNPAMSSHSSCPGSKIMQIRRTETPESEKPASTADSISKLQNWPVQIKLAPVHAPYFNDAKLLIAADCTAYAYASFHQDFIRNKVTLIGCPKLDQVDYSEKLTGIIQNNNIQSVTIVRMEVPCCGGLEMAAKKALQNSGKFIPWQVVTISIDGKILE